MNKVFKLWMLILIGLYVCTANASQLVRYEPFNYSDEFAVKVKTHDIKTHIEVGQDEVQQETFESLAHHHIPKENHPIYNLRLRMR